MLVVPVHVLLAPGGLCVGGIPRLLRVARHCLLTPWGVGDGKGCGFPVSPLLSQAPLRPTQAAAGLVQDCSSSDAQLVLTTVSLLHLSLVFFPCGLPSSLLDVTALDRAPEGPQDSGTFSELPPLPEALGEERLLGSPAVKGHLSPLLCSRLPSLTGASCSGFILWLISGQEGRKSLFFWTVLVARGILFLSLAGLRTGLAGVA